MAESASGLILRMTRTFDAEPERVFAAWTDPEAFGSWFGPAGMKTVQCEVDPKVGGVWRLMGEGKNLPGRDTADLVRPTVSGKYLVPQQSHEGEGHPDEVPAVELRCGEILVLAVEPLATARHLT